LALCCLGAADLPDNALQPRFLETSPAGADASIPLTDAVQKALVQASAPLISSTSGGSTSTVSSQAGSSALSASLSLPVVTSSSLSNSHISHTGSLSTQSSSSSSQSESEEEEQLPLTDLIGEPPHTSLTDKQVDAVARNILKEARKGFCDKKHGCAKKIILEDPSTCKNCPAAMPSASTSSSSGSESKHSSSSSGSSESSGTGSSSESSHSKSSGSSSSSSSDSSSHSSLSSESLSSSTH